MKTITINGNEYPSSDFCQSCSMPMEYGEPGTEANGAKSEDYCHHCMADGKFIYGGTVESVVDVCAPYKVQAGVYPDVETARAAMMEYFPSLKRWAVRDGG